MRPGRGKHCKVGRLWGGATAQAEELALAGNVNGLSASMEETEESVVINAGMGASGSVGHI